jgi:hypothetical protein
MHRWERIVKLSTGNYIFLCACRQPTAQVTMTNCRFILCGRRFDLLVLRAEKRTQFMEACNNYYKPILSIIIKRRISMTELLRVLSRDALTSFAG